MAKLKICGCCYDDDKGKHHQGLYIHNRKTNTFTILNKKLEKVTKVKSVITCESSMGNIFIDVI